MTNFFKRFSSYNDEGWKYAYPTMKESDPILWVVDIEQPGKETTVQYGFPFGFYVPVIFKSSTPIIDLFFGTDFEGRLGVQLDYVFEVFTGVEWVQIAADSMRGKLNRQPAYVRENTFHVPLDAKQLRCRRVSELQPGQRSEMFLKAMTSK